MHCNGGGKELRESALIGVLFFLADGVRGILQHGHVLLVGRQDVLAVPRGAGKIPRESERERERERQRIAKTSVQNEIIVLLDLSVAM